MSLYNKFVRKSTNAVYLFVIFLIRYMNINDQME
jgi:hypothetical protein